MLGFSAATMLLTYAIERLQNLPALESAAPRRRGTDLAFNTAASFTTNTNWQFYTPESTMSYLTEMAGLATHNFWSAAAGIVVAIALIRGIKRTSSGTIGNFWVDMTRTLLYILTPACILYALLLVWQGVPQNLSAYTVAHTLEQPNRTAPCKPLGKGRSPRRKPSRCWALTAAASSMPTAPTPMRTPRRSRTTSRYFRSSSSAPVSLIPWAG